MNEIIIGIKRNMLKELYRRIELKVHNLKADNEYIHKLIVNEIMLRNDELKIAKLSLERENNTDMISDLYTRKRNIKTKLLGLN